MHSEAMMMLYHMDVEVDIVRLDRYYSVAVYVDKFGGKTYIIPKKSSTLRGSKKWKHMMKEFIVNVMEHLEQYHRRSNSEAGFSVDKKILG